MSQTRSVGVYGRTYWSYTAAAMVDSLGTMISARRINDEGVPKAIQYGAVRFFNIVLEGASDEAPTASPLAGINAYGIAVDAMEMSSRPFVESRGEIDRLLGDYIEFTKSLGEARELSEGEVETATSLRKFFHHLWRGGESEAYERVVEMDDPSSSMT